mgnify:CR=1 FL=1
MAEHEIGVFAGAGLDLERHDRFGYSSFDDEAGPWCHGPASCNVCGRSWTAVWPLGADALQCPHCCSHDTEREVLPIPENKE